MTEHTEDWNEIITRNEVALADLEQRVSQSRYSELKLWKDHQLFTIRKGIPMNPQGWDLWTPKDTYFGDSALEVIKQAVIAGYHDIWEWLPEFNDR